MFYSKKFKKFYNLIHCFFSRKGGFSRGLYKGLNCGRGSKDKKKNIIMNLKKEKKKAQVKKIKKKILDGGTKLGLTFYIHTG